MSDKGKRIFLALSIILPFLFYCVYYYGHVFKVAPYKFTEFKSIVFQYGYGDSLVNKYNSQTGDYQYMDKRDSLVKMNLLLTKSDLLYLHQKAAELGFWDFPSDETNADTAKINGMRSPRYLMEFNYQRKSKKVVFDESFVGDERLKDANERMKLEIMRVLAEAEERKKK